MLPEDLDAYLTWPLPNVWLGTSVEDQATADERVPHLLRCPAAIRFVSYEPALGPVDLTHLDLTWKLRDGLAEFAARQGRDPMEAAATVEPGVAHINALRGYWFDGEDSDTDLPPLDWVIAGGESGLGARPPHPKWFRDVRDQCEAAGVAFHFKQWGEWAPDEEEGVSKTALVRFSANTAVGMGRWAPTYMYRVGKRAAGRLLDGREHSKFPAPLLAREQ